MPSTSRTSFDIRLPLRGAGGEPVHFYRTIASHGVARLLPAKIDVAAQSYSTVVRIGGAPVPITLSEKGGYILIAVPRRASVAIKNGVRDAVVRMFRLDHDLAPFYAMIAKDPMLSWASVGAGRLLASPRVFDDVIKTVCTTNCAWSATVRMTTALAQLGGGAFPEPELLAATSDEWFRDVGRMGYRGAYIRAIAERVIRKEVDLEGMLPQFGRDDAQVEAQLLELPGIGPYGAAHIMQLLGRHRRLILDSWTRPTYLRRAGKKRATDATIVRAFARYGPYAGLAFWLFLTQEWT